MTDAGRYPLLRVVTTTHLDIGVAVTAYHDAVKAAHEAGEPLRAIAAAAGVSHTTIATIVNQENK